jgi:hypothetical protein
VGVCHHVPGTGLGGVAMDAILRYVPKGLVPGPADGTSLGAERRSSKCVYSIHDLNSQ